MAGIYSDIVTEIVARLTYHVATAVPVRLLDGMKLKEYPEKETLGADDIPQVALFPLDFSEQVVARMPYKASVTVRLVLSVQRDKGVPAATVWIEKLLDALDTKHDGSGDKDLRLSNTLRGPFSVAVANPLIQDLAMNFHIALSCKPRKIAVRAGRVG